MNVFKKKYKDYYLFKKNTKIIIHLKKIQKLLFI